MTRPHSIPARAGVGLKPQHYEEILTEKPDLGWFEVHAENYMGAGGPPHRYLTAIRQDYPISLHGVGLSIGSEGELDADHLLRLKALVDRYEPGLFSEHLAWSSHGGTYFNDLLPLPYSEKTLARVCEHVDQVQSVLGRQMLLENPSTYVSFWVSTMEEIDFLKDVVARSGCGLLLDVNNVLVSAVNHGFDAEQYIDAFPIDAVGEIHLAGHAETHDGETEDCGARVLIDAHDREVDDAVWALYAQALSRSGPLPSLIEWDNDLPDWQTLFAEAQRAERVLLAESAPVAIQPARSVAHG